jgi:hypothetical protein
MWEPTTATIIREPLPAAAGRRRRSLSEVDGIAAAQAVKVVA